MGRGAASPVASPWHRAPGSAASKSQRSPPASPGGRGGLARATAVATVTVTGRAKTGGSTSTETRRFTPTPAAAPGARRVLLPPRGPRGQVPAPCSWARPRVGLPGSAGRCRFSLWPPVIWPRILLRGRHILAPSRPVPPNSQGGESRARLALGAGDSPQTRPRPVEPDSARRFPKRPPRSPDVGLGGSPVPVPHHSGEGDGPDGAAGSQFLPCELV